MKILLVSRYKEQFTQNMLPFVLEQGESLRAVCRDAQGKPITVDYFTVRGNYVKAALELRNKIRETRPDIVHAHYGLSGVTASLAFLLPNTFPNTKLVTTFHNGETLNRKVNFLCSLFSLRADHVIYVAEHIRDKAIFVNKHNTILPCGVNLEESKPTDYQSARTQLGFDPEKYYILFGGAFSNTRKNVALLREAVENLHTGTDRLAALCKNIEILEMRGMDRKTVALYMSACDMFALPSKSEGSPQALKEAMACGCPCLATDIADVRLLLGGLEGNYICSFDPTDVAHGVEQLLSLPRGFRTQGRERIIQLGYRNEDVAEKLMEIYGGLRTLG